MDDNRIPPRPMSLPAPLEGQQMPIEQKPLSPVPNVPSAQEIPHAAQQQVELQARDTEVIEPAWAQRTEELIQRYANDPHGLSQALYELKSEYVYKRYGKSLKQATEHKDG